MTFGIDRLTWSKREKQVARAAFEKAYEVKCAELLAKVHKMAAAAREPRDLWRIHDFLDDERRETDRKYDYRYSVLVLVFGRLVHEGRLTLKDLEGLNEDKLVKIRTIVELGRRASDSDERQKRAGVDGSDA